ncbi:MAG TPA: adenylate/guanylate cyclase domain-containing protein [Candidatus Limnocylindrales bacterium]|jgi:adenylate cyclase
MTAPEREAGTEEMWRAMLLGTDPIYARNRRRFKHLPSSPRCKMCNAPFAGPGALLLQLIGRRRWAKNGKYCGQCFTTLQTHHGGAEIDCSLLFADVRGSTSLAERMRPAEFSRLLQRFYGVATEVLTEEDAIVDKFVGDEVVAIFIPALTGDAHARRAVDAARALLRATGHEEPGGPWIPVGAGVTTGVAYVGAVGSGDQPEITALGDVVNTAARLASAAGPGELLVTLPAARFGGVAPDDHEQRTLHLKGKAEPVEVLVVSSRAELAAAV